MGSSIYVAAGERLFELNKSNGKIIRYSDMGINLDTATAPYIVDGIGYFCTAKTGVVAYELSTFKKLAEYRTGNAMTFTSPYTSGEIATVESSIARLGEDLVFGASDGYIYRLDKNLNLIRKYFVGSPVLSSLEVVGDDVIALDFSGNITRICLK